MAAIDKMYLKDYYAFDKFRLWCLIHNPKLLKHFYHWNLIQQEWDRWKENTYQFHKGTYDEELKHASTVELLREHYEKCGYNPSIEQLEREVAYVLTQVEKLKDKATYIANISLPITNFSCKEDRYLLWHCPIEEVREYLIKQCGYKERWYYKLFFKY
jgi:hypothetical protein